MSHHAENTALVLAQGGLPPLSRMVLPLVYSATQLPAANGAPAAMQALHKVLQNECTPQSWPSEAAAVAAVRRLASAFPLDGAPGISLELLRKVVAFADSAEKGAAHAVASLLVRAARERHPRAPPASAARKPDRRLPPSPPLPHPALAPHLPLIVSHLLALGPRLYHCDIYTYIYHCAGARGRG